MLLIPSVTLATECVVLLHGLARTASSMNKMQKALDKAGYATANVNYPSRHHAVDVLAPMAIDKGLALCREESDVERIHFVTHSLGGILLRVYLEDNEIEELARVVMLGPPNQGSAAVDAFRGIPGFDWLNGPAGHQLGTDEESIPATLGPVEFELGVIAGNRSIDPITSAVLKNPDDGRVSVEDTKVEGMDDFVIVTHSHAFMMRMKNTIELTHRFLKTGEFNDGDSQ